MTAESRRDLNADVDLTREADFHFGSVHVSPSTRELIAPANTFVVEPRVMQVLVRLARSQGAVVSRDDLIRSCWGGRIVGEDAINRCIAKIRQLAEGAKEPTFAVSAAGILSRQSAKALTAFAKSLFFKDRTWPALLKEFRRRSPGEAAHLARWLPRNKVERKRLDALEMIARLRTDLKLPWRPGPEFIFQKTTHWVRFVERSS